MSKKFRITESQKEPKKVGVCNTYMTAESFKDAEFWALRNFMHRIEFWMQDAKQGDKIKFELTLECEADLS